MASKNITGLGLITASSGGAVVDSSGQKYNKVVIQADPQNTGTEYILVYDVDGILLAKLSPGGATTIGDESFSDVIDPGKITVKSTTGAGKYTGLMYQR